MGKKNYGLILFVLLVIGVIYLFPAAAKENPSTAARLFEAIESSGGNVFSIETRTSLQIAQVNSTKELELLAKEWADRLTIPKTNLEVSIKNDMYVCQIVDNIGKTRIIYRIIGVSKNGIYDVYMVLHMIGNNQNLQDVEAVQHAVTETLTESDITPQFSTCLRGMYSDKLSVDQQESKILSIFRILRADEVERLEDETVVSVSGYTKEWEHFIEINDYRMNLQAATHLDRKSVV